jgi:hypothetical protein
MEVLLWLCGVGVVLLAIRVFKAKDSEPPLVAQLAGPGLFTVDVVGEAHYQDQIESVVGKPTEDGSDKVVQAALVLEDSNVHDPMAVRVDIEGVTCGYLSRANARAYRRAIEKLGHGPLIGQCQAVVVGGWKRGDDRGKFGVKLDLPVAA